MPLERQHTRRLAFPPHIPLLLSISLSLCYSLYHTRSLRLLSLYYFSHCVKPVCSVYLKYCFLASRFHQLLSTHTSPCCSFLCRLQTTSSALKGAIQLGIGYTVGNLSSKPERDVLMQDFYVVESIFFPRWVLYEWMCMCTACAYICEWEVSNTIIFILFFLMVPPCSI